MVELMPQRGGIGSKPKPQAPSRRRIEDEVETNAVEDIDMDVNDRAGDERREKQAKQRKDKLDAEDKAFLDLFK